jgi:Fe-S cluster biosynthesis and repair protein YggX
MSVRLVRCAKFNQELPGLTKPPFRGEIGKKIFDNSSQQAWDEWQEMQIKVLNEYRLDMSDSQQYKQLIDTMLSFLGLAEGEVPEVENAERGK